MAERREEKYIFNLRRQQISAKMSRLFRQTIRSVRFFALHIFAYFFSFLRHYHIHISEEFRFNAGNERATGYNVAQISSRQQQQRQRNLADSGRRLLRDSHSPTTTRSPHMDLFTVHFHLVAVCRLVLYYPRAERVRRTSH